MYYVNDAHDKHMALFSYVNEISVLVSMEDLPIKSHLFIAVVVVHRGIQQTFQMGRLRRLKIIAEIPPTIRKVPGVIPRQRRGARKPAVCPCVVSESVSLYVTRVVPMWHYYACGLPMSGE